MAGPNPYRLHSFRELRAIMGRPYVVCRPCRRFVAVGAWLDARDTRATTFSCSVCGSAGDVVLEDPGKDGLQHDPRPNPLRHRLAMIRLQALHQHASRFGRREPPREEARPREKPPRPPPDPVFRRVPMPFRTFREASAFGLALKLHCPSCHDWRQIELSEGQLDRSFAGLGRFVCGCVKRKMYGEGTEVCGATGWPVLAPVDKPGADRQVVDMECGGRRHFHHPRWEINGVDLKAASWAGLIDTSTERFRCPGCGGMARHTFHAPYPHRPSEPSDPVDKPTF